MICLIDSVYVQNIQKLMNKCYTIIDHSVGLQEEAPSFGKPLLVLRTETERPEGIEAGTVKLAGITEDGIYNMASKLLMSKDSYQAMAKAVNPYGDRKASERIVQAILHKFKLGEKQEGFDI